ncbi:MAG: RNA-protein complex protein Nop10 [Candidatus Bathyarchaeia archaeon]|nr:RNA-protein complex protein Nop10 [Candidatus Bathyarchaeota archaeon]
MKMQIKKCGKCNRYTLKENCPLCGEKTFNPHPPKFSLNDKYLELRLKAEKK